MGSSEEQLEHLRNAAAIAGVIVPRFVVPDEHDVILRRMRFHYLDWGSRGKRPILFLHGGGLSAHTWDLVCLALRPDYHCLALDQRGHGDTDWSPAREYDLEEFVRAPAELDSVEEFVERARAFNPARDPRLLRRSLLYNLRRLPGGKWTW